MAVPILKQGDFLIASIQSALSDVEVLELRDEITDRVGETRARGVVVDVAVALVQFELNLEPLHTALDLEEGLTLLGRRTGHHNGQ